MKKLSICFLLILSFAACNDSDVVLSAGDDAVSAFVDEEPSVVPIEEALEKLDAFMNSVNLVNTRSGMKREIETIETHYDKDASGTRAAKIPDAYLVNFKNEEGFAVLGANTSVTPIVAVTEKGSLEPGFLDMVFDDNPITEDVDGNIIDLATFDYYSEEYDDYYVMQTAPKKQLLQDFLKDGIGHTGGGHATEYATCDPNLLSTKWSQGTWDLQGVYNRYCYKKKTFGGKKYVKAGCSTVAMASIVARNKYPTNLYVNDNLINYSEITKYETPLQNKATEAMKEGVALLIGSIFHSVDPVFRWKAGTCITPEEIKACFEKFGYTNVKKYGDSTFSPTLMKATSDMLANRKPVFVSAMPLGKDGHSWVIDGSHYEEDDWKVFCKWGFNNGECDGWYSTNCFKPDPDSANEYKEYTWHFRVVTYDIPTQSSTININF